MRKRGVRGLPLSLLLLFLPWRALGDAEPLIQVNVEAVEVSNSRADEVGLKWSESLSVEERDTPALFTVARLERLTKIRADLNLLMKKGAAHLLANPKLITTSGTTASFITGGEVPYPTRGLRGEGAQVQWKQYGVILEVTPTLDGDYIRTVVRASVSAIDWTNAVTASDIRVPALTSRAVTSDVKVRAGETITLAGLIQTRKEQTVTGIPLLGDLPLIGVLFSRQGWTNEKTTVVIFLTPSRFTQTGVK